jgi:hypothetical protein
VETEAYTKFIESKKIISVPTGLKEDVEINPMLFSFQTAIVKWALRRGRACVFADCGTGKTPIQLEWAKHIPGKVLILAPLAVAEQTRREGIKFGIPVKHARQHSEIGVSDKIVVTNYEMLHKFDVSQFSGIVLDESSILKSQDSKTRQIILDSFSQTPYRLACTATPAPNDFMELGNHSEFVGALSYTEMLSTFFVHDGGETQKWRLKKHAEGDFWKWLCSWAVLLRKPSDLGYEDDGFILPEIRYHHVVVKAESSTDGFLFSMEAQTLNERQRARKVTITERVAAAAKIILLSNQKIDTLMTLCENQKKLPVRICDNTILSISKGGIGVRKSNETLLTQPGEKNIELTQNMPINAEPRLNLDHQKLDDHQELVSTELVFPNTMQCSNFSQESVQFATENSMEKEQFTSIIAIPAEKLEDFCVPNVILESENSRIVGNYSGEQWIIWCNLNLEADAAEIAIPGAVQVCGSDLREFKEQAVVDFINGKTQVLISKPTIFGYGLNLQQCSKIIFLGLSDSFEQFYQATRRCWRFGQTKPVDVYIVTAETEGAVVKNIQRKEADAKRMADNMIEHMADINSANIRGIARTETEYQTKKTEGKDWTALLGDCVPTCRDMPDNSVDYSIFSPPFASLYTYSASDRDMGNCRSGDDFMKHFSYLIDDLLRVTKPGRLLSFHCMNLPTSKTHDGFIGIKDFRGDLIRLFQEHGWIYHSEVVIWKDPVTAMQRTKALGLLHKQLVKDSCMSRQGIPDYLVTMRKPGENLNRVTGKLDTFIGDQSMFKRDGDLSIDIWQRYASPVWMDIRATRTLQYRAARDGNDERHICPLQLDVIERALQLWTNEGDIVLSPFAGIGSEGYCAIKMKRKFIGIELKPSYYDTMVSNLKQAERDREVVSLFDMPETVEQDPDSNVENLNL